MKNKDIQIITSVLTPLSLDIAESSARRRFLRILKPFIEDMDLEIQEMKKKYAEKKPDGSMKTIGETIEFTIPNRKLYNADYYKLLDLDISPVFTGSEADLEKSKELMTKSIAEFETAQKGKFNDQEYEMLERMKSAVEAMV